MNIAIDLDGTLAGWNTASFQDIEHCKDDRQVGEPLNGSLVALRLLCDQGDNVVVHSCRATWADGGEWAAIARWLVESGFRPVLIEESGPWRLRAADALTEFAVEDAAGLERGSLPRVPAGAPLIGIWLAVGKPIAHLYVDDRAIYFDGNWTSTVRMIDAVRAGGAIPPHAGSLGPAVAALEALAQLVRAVEDDDSHGMASSDTVDFAKQGRAALDEFFGGADWDAAVS